MFLTFYKNRCLSDKAAWSFIHEFIQENAVRRGSYSVDFSCAADQMKALRKDSGAKLKDKVYHIMVTFLEHETRRLTADDVAEMARKVCAEYSEDYQMVYAVHYYALRLYLHIVINPINMHTKEVLKMDACERGMMEAYVLRYSGLEKISTYATDCREKDS